MKLKTISYFDIIRVVDEMFDQQLAEGVKSSAAASACFYYYASHAECLIQIMVVNVRAATLELRFSGSIRRGNASPSLNYYWPLVQLYNLIRDKASWGEFDPSKTLYDCLCDSYNSHHKDAEDLDVIFEKFPDMKACLKGFPLQAFLNEEGHLICFEGEARFDADVKMLHIFITKEGWSEFWL